jgi:predicted nucleotidyltransferase
MEKIVEEKLPQVRDLCRKYNVRKLEIFGSAVGENFNAKSDVDFIVEFAPMHWKNHADSFWGMWDDLKTLYNREVDLLEKETIENPYFLASIAASRKVIFE